MINWLFDVDGVLCDVGQPMNEEFKAWFLEWSQGKNIYFVTGGRRENLFEQVGNEIVKRASMCFHCMGNQIFIDDREYLINQFELKQHEREWLEEAVINSPFHIKTGNHIELRKGSLNFSIVGRNANIEERLEYQRWDNVTKERIAIRNKFVNMFPRFEGYLGGNISIDICLNGANKGQCVSLLIERNIPSYFFGDRCNPGEIDAPICNVLPPDQGNKVFEVNGYKNTWEVLKTL